MNTVGNPSLIGRTRQEISIPYHISEGTHFYLILNETILQALA